MKYKDQYQQIHKKKKYGCTGDYYVDKLYPVINKEVHSILDYGAGQSSTAKLLATKLGLSDYAEYDPCVEGRDVKPDRTFDVVLNTDVMEHVPEEEINHVLTEIWGYTDKEAYFVIALREAAEILPNGENAHCTVESKEWWQKRLSSVFDQVEELKAFNIPYSLVGFKCSSS